MYTAYQGSSTMPRVSLTGEKTHNEIIQVRQSFASMYASCSPRILYRRPMGPSGMAMDQRFVPARAVPLRLTRATDGIFLFVTLRKGADAGWNTGTGAWERGYGIEVELGAARLPIPGAL